MGSRSGSGRRPDSARDRRPESKDSQVGVIIAPDGPSLGARLRQGAHRENRWGGFILTLGRVVSTNDVALEYAKKGAPHGSLFIATEQTGGRGRFGRRWESYPGGLYLSVLLRPRPDERDRVALLPHLSAVAAAEAVIETASLDVRLRWPNDLYTGGRKLGGILCEGSFRGDEAEAFVVGIGINVNQRVEDFPADVERRATVLSEHALDVFHGSHRPHRPHRLDIAAGVVTGVETWWRRREPAQILARFRELAEGATGHAIQVQPRGVESEPYRALTRGIADDGGLIVELGDGEERILYSEDVFQLRDGDDRPR